MLSAAFCVAAASANAYDLPYDFAGWVMLNVAYYTLSGKNGTNNNLGITLTKFNKFSQLLAQFMLTCQLTKKITKSTVTTCTTLCNNDVRCTKHASLIWTTSNIAVPSVL